MRFLPALYTDPQRQSLPMADRSAAALIDLILKNAEVGDGTNRSANARLSEALADDPLLTLWAVCAADRHAAYRPGGIDELARWLAEHALDVLQWNGNGFDQPLDEPANSESTAEWLLAGLQVADLAAQLTNSRKESSVDEAFLLGLLHNASCWLAPGGEGGEADGLPDWVANWRESPEGPAVIQAIDMLAAEQELPRTDAIDLTSLRARGQQRRERWFEILPGLGDWLPALTAKMARLRDLREEFDRTLEEEKLEAMAEFAAGAGHEINNPLTVIAGRAQLFLREEKDPQRRRALALMNAQAKRVYEMIADMMLFARPPEPKPESIDLIEIIDQVLEEMSPHAAHQETMLRYVGSHEPLPLAADPVQLTMMLKAMCQNALEAIGREGSIEIHAASLGQEVQVTVSDDGPGISPEERRHLFDPYYSARQAGRGLGLGLSKAWRIATGHGGRIEVDSQPGHGATFTVSLPSK